jgi:hypothetical protein
MDTHEDDPERRKDEQDVLGKLLNMIGSLRDELAKLWSRNAVLEKELSDLKPKDAVHDSSSIKREQPLLRDNREDGQEALDPTADEGDGGETVTGALSIRSKVKCLHCDADAELDKKCCDKPACEECSEFGKFARSLGDCEIDV